MEAAEKVGKSVVSADKALASISKHSELTLQEVMEKQPPTTGTEIKLVDVTHKMFEKHVGEELPASNVSIYKGIIANLISWARGDQADELYGIMAGDGKSILDVVICTNLQDCISSSSYANRLTKESLQTMGLAIWVKDFNDDVDKFLQPLKELKSPLNTLVLLVMCGGHDPCVWEVTIPEEGSATWTKCSGPKASSGRKKDEKYRVVDFDALSKNTSNNMQDTVSTMLRESSKELVCRKLKSRNGSEKCSLEEHHVPADGFCFWHCVLGTLDFESWCSMP